MEKGSISEGLKSSRRYEMLNLLNVDRAKIYVTPLGVGRSFMPNGKRMQGLPDQYILFLGNLEPRKNLQSLLAAYRSLPRNLRDRYALVITGAKAWPTNKLRKALCSPQKDEKIVFTGYVPRSRFPIFTGEHHSLSILLFTKGLVCR
jgi:glycosyltransferase involved in cell wall biosynthesis